MISKKVINELADKALKSGNPYIGGAIVFQIDGVDRFIYADGVYTKDELDDEYVKTARKDIEVGFKDRMVGYYDKWYRYSRADEGRAYDLGVQFAVSQPKCKGEMHIIPCVV